MAFTWDDPQGVTHTFTNQQLTEALDGEHGDEARDWALDIFPSLKEQGYFDDPEQFGWGEEGDEGDPEPDDGLSVPELEERLAALEDREAASVAGDYGYEDDPEPPPQWRDAGWEKRMKEKIQHMEEGLGRELTEAEGRALVADVEALGSIPADFAERYAPALAARESTPAGRREVMAEEVGDNMHRLEIDLEVHQEPRNQKEADRQEMVEALEADQAGIEREPILAGIEAEAPESEESE